MSPSEFVFLAGGLALGVLAGGALIEVFRARPAAQREVRVTISTGPAGGAPRPWPRRSWRPRWREGATMSSPHGPRATERPFGAVRGRRSRSWPGIRPVPRGPRERARHGPGRAGRPVRGAARGCRRGVRARGPDGRGGGRGPRATARCATRLRRARGTPRARGRDGRSADDPRGQGRGPGAVPAQPARGAGPGGGRRGRRGLAARDQPDQRPHPRGGPRDGARGRRRDRSCSGPSSRPAWTRTSPGSAASTRPRHAGPR